MGLKFTALVEGGSRAIIQTIIYVFVSIVLIAMIGIFILNWGVLPSFIFASMVGGETTAAVVVPLSRSMQLKETTAAFLTLESAINSVFSVVLFFTFTSVYSAGASSWFVAVTNIAAQFSVAIVLGLILSIIWIFLLHRYQKQKFTYVLTLGFALASYSLTSALGGNGILSVLVFGIILGNNHLVSKLLRRDINIESIHRQLDTFQEEISFLMETLFFVFLGLTFVINSSTVISSFSIGLLVLGVLLTVRFGATTLSTLNSGLYCERRTIVFMCSQGLTPATLAILAVTMNIPLADTFLNVVTYVIIFTNIVTTIGTYLYRRDQKQGFIPRVHKPIWKRRLDKQE